MTIRAERFALNTDTFAAERKQALESSDVILFEVIKKALPRLGMNRWQEPIVEAALKVFDSTAKLEMDGESQVFTDMREEFERELTESLKKTKKGDLQNQSETLSRWLSTYATNAGTEAAVVSDTENTVGLEWVTMSDDDVRTSHKEAAGQVVPSGQPFSVAGEELLYPGQPVGDPSVWISCRCLARPTILEEGFTAKAGAFAAAAPGLKKDGTPPVCDFCSNVATGYVLHSEGMAFTPFCAEHEQKAKDAAAGSAPSGGSDPSNIDRVAEYALTAAAEEAKDTSSIIVAIAANGDPVYDTSSEDIPHVTLLWLGDAADFDPEPIKAELDGYIEASSGGPFDEKVASSSFTLGADGAEVVLLDAENLAVIRGAILASEAVRARHDQVEQFPTWIPHLTLGYSEAPKKGELEQATIKFDRIALWHSDEQFVFPLAGNVEVVNDEGAEPDATKPAFAILEDPDEKEEPKDTTPAEPDEGEEAPPELDEAELFMPVPWHGILAPEGVASGDARLFALNALSNRDLPITLKRQVEDADGHDGSFPVARVDKIWKDEDGLTWGEGVFDYNEEGYEAVRVIAEQIQTGLSVDVTDVEGEQGEDGLTTYTAAKVGAVTICSVPAFEIAKIFLGPAKEIEADEAETEEMPIPEGAEASVSRLTDDDSTFDIVPRKTKDGPGWITEPKPTKRITAYWVDGAGAAKINWGVPGDFNRCRLNLGKYVQNPKWLAGLCANLHYRALGVWPGQASGKVVTMSSLTAAAAGSEVEAGIPSLPADWFRDPLLQEKTAFTVSKDGRVFGHLAAWDTCHIGVGKECTTAPASRTNYAYFLTGEVDTDAGPVPVGQVTMASGHADGKYGVRPAAAHYDNTAYAVADVTVGEDQFGVWVAGALRGDVSPTDVHALRASGSLSGDWRRVVVGGAGELELVAALAVNVPGFPIPRPRFAMAGERQLSLVAAGVVSHDERDTLDDERLEAALARRDRSARALSARQTVKAARVADIRKRTNLEGR